MGEPLTDAAAPTPEAAGLLRAQRYLDEIEAEADKAIDGVRPLNAPWLVSVVREARTALATVSSQPDRDLDAEEGT